MSARRFARCVAQASENAKELPLEAPGVGTRGSSGQPMRDSVLFRVFRHSMRIAFVVGSAYEKNGQLAALPSAEIDVELLSRRLGQDGAGPKLVELAAERGLADQVEQVLLDEAEPIEAVLFAFFGYSVLSKERGLALLLDGDRLGTFSLVRLRSLLERYAPRVCVIAELFSVVDAEQSPREVLDSGLRALTQASRATSALLCVRPGEELDGATPTLPRLLVSALDWLAANNAGERPISLCEIYRSLVTDAEWTTFPAAGLVPLDSPFPVLPAAAPEGETADARAPEPAMALPSAPAPAAASAPTTEAADLDGPSLPALEPDASASAAPTPDAAEAERSPAPDGSSEAEPAPSDRLTVSLETPAEESSSDDRSEDDDDDRPTAPPALLTNRSSSEDDLAPVPPPLPAGAVVRLPPPPIPPAAPSAGGVLPAAPPVAVGATVPTPVPAAAVALHDPDAHEETTVSAAKPKNGSALRNGHEATASGGAEDVSWLWAPAAGASDGGSPSEHRGTVAVEAPSERLLEGPESEALPSFGGVTTLADELLANGDFLAAIQEYEAVLVLVTEPSERAGALARFSRALAGSARLDEAAQRLGEAAALDAKHPDVVRARAELDAARGDMESLVLSAEALLARTPEDPVAIEWLMRAAEATGDGRRLVAARCRHARHVLTGPERAEAFLQAAELAATLGEADELALSATLEGLELAPSHLGLLDRASLLLERTGRQRELLAYYDRALGQILDPETTTAISERMARIAASPEGDPVVAAAAFERLVDARPTDLELRARLIDLYARAGDPTRALVHCRATARLAPLHVETYRAAHTLFRSQGDDDGAWNAACVLEAHEAADINEALFVSQHRPEGLPPAREPVPSAAWETTLFAEDEEPELRAFFTALGPAVGRVGVAFQKEKKRYAEPSPETLQDPEKSTTMLAKTLLWTARLLGVSVPTLFVVPELATGLDVLPLDPPGVAASRALGSGHSLGQLAFLWGRLLPRYRPELTPLRYFRTPSELAAFTIAAVAAAGSSVVDTRGFDRDTKRLYGALRRELKSGDTARLKAAGARVPVQDIAPRLERLLRAADLSGVRAGLVAAGDVTVAADLIRRFPAEGVTTAEAQLGELFQFAIGERYGLLRRKLGVAVERE